MQHVMPWHGLVGGMMIGLSAGLFLLLAGRVSGISGIIENGLTPSGRSFGWSVAYLAGLPLGALAVSLLAPHLVPVIHLSPSWPLIIGAGLLVGFGTRLAGGCTSGHGVCGLPRLSPRSLVATGIFMAVAAATVFVTRHVL